MMSVMVSTPSLPSNAASISSSSPTIGFFLTGLLVFGSKVHGLCLCEKPCLLQVEDLVDFGCVDVLDRGVVGVGVVLLHVVEKVSATAVAKEGQDVSAVDILPERSTDAFRGLCRLRNLRHDDAGLFLSC